MVLIRDDMDGKNTYESRTAMKISNSLSSFKILDFKNPKKNNSH
jgi:hypothetical protein